ncbi:MAG: zf-HC2 domain-containing protein [Anaerolineae bacterium]
MNAITCHDCRVLIPAYIDRELARSSRSKVAAHLDTCDHCYAEYVRQRDMQAELRVDLPALGRLEPARAGAIWRSVQSELISPRRTVWPFGQRRVGMLAVLITAALLLPWLLSPGRLAALSLPVPPTPATVNAAATDAPLVSLLPTAEFGISLPVTPPSQPEYAPTQAADQTVRPNTEPRLTPDAQAR